MYLWTFYSRPRVLDHCFVAICLISSLVVLRLAVEKVMLRSNVALQGFDSATLIVWVVGATSRSVFSSDTN